MSVKFEDFSVQVIASFNDACIAYLHEACGELEAQVKRNSRVSSGQTKNSWTYKIDEGKGEGIVGSPLENAIWEEFGTGEFALHGDGRKGGWVYRDDKGDFHYTEGKAPNRALHNAFTKLKPALKKRAEEVIGGNMS